MNDWLISKNCHAMWHHLSIACVKGYYPRKTLSRKSRLFRLACCRQYTEMGVAFKNQLNLAEDLADDVSLRPKMAEVLTEMAQTVFKLEYISYKDVLSIAVNYNNFFDTDTVTKNILERFGRFKTVPSLMRTIFGNPFRPAVIGNRCPKCNNSLQNGTPVDFLECLRCATCKYVWTPFDPAWFTETVVSMANTIYTERDFGSMPILADALQDAGCDLLSIDRYCRDGEPKFRGDWLIDLILRK